MKSKGVAYLLWLFSGFGWLGFLVRPRVPRHFPALKNTVDRLRLAQRDHYKYDAV
jgi:hypothetical protein